MRVCGLRHLLFWNNCEPRYGKQNTFYKGLCRSTTKIWNKRLVFLLLLLFVCLFVFRGKGMSVSIMIFIFYFIIFFFKIICYGYAEMILSSCCGASSFLREICLKVKICISLQVEQNISPDPENKVKKNHVLLQPRMTCSGSWLAFQREGRPAGPSLRWVTQLSYTPSPGKTRLVSTRVRGKPLPMKTCRQHQVCGTAGGHTVCKPLTTGNHLSWACFGLLPFALVFYYRGAYERGFLF